MFISRTRVSRSRSTIYGFRLNKRRTQVLTRDRHRTEVLTKDRNRTDVIAKDEKDRALSKGPKQDLKPAKALLVPEHRFQQGGLGVGGV